jgi:hypothetical protein
VVQVTTQIGTKTDGETERKIARTKKRSKNVKKAS